MAYRRVLFTFVAAWSSGCFAPTDIYMDTDASSGTDGSTDPTTTTTATTSATTSMTSVSTTDTTTTASTTTTDATTDTTTDVDTTDTPTSTESSSETTDPDSSGSTGADPVCGNNEPEGDEECDDGNLINTDACKNDCTNAVCGDGVVGPGDECDDANEDNSDLCTTNCTDAACGDGFDQGNEQCDDGDSQDHDGCNALCVTEPFCEDFDGFDCPSGALEFCDTAPISCSDEADAISACEACVGAGADCQGSHGVDGCNEGSGVVDENGACPGLLNFVYNGDVCNNGLVSDECQGGQLGSWCTP